MVVAFHAGTIISYYTAIASNNTCSAKNLDHFDDNEILDPIVTESDHVIIGRSSRYAAKSQWTGNGLHL